MKLIILVSVSINVFIYETHIGAIQVVIIKDHYHKCEYEIVQH